MFFQNQEWSLALKSLIKKLKKVWAAGNESSCCLYSGCFGTATIYYGVKVKGWIKGIDSSYRKPLPQRYNEVYGEGAWDYYLSDYAKFVESRWSELLIYAKGSKFQIRDQENAGSTLSYF